MTARTVHGTEGSLPSGLPNPTIHITTNNSSGIAEVHSSRQNDWQFMRSDSVGFNVVYTTSEFPVSLNSDADIETHQKTVAGGKLGLALKNGTVCRFVDFSPTSEPMMHRTQSLDYGVVLEGEVDMVLDDGSVTHLKKGDVAVQRGTMHAWKNSSGKWARMLFVLLDCQPLVVGGNRLGEDLTRGRGADIPPSGNDTD